MKILLSPSKTQSYKKPENFSNDFFQNTQNAENIQNSQNKKNINKVTEKIKAILLEQNISIENLKNKDTSKLTPAIFTYTGLVFKQIDFLQYGEKQYKYLNDNLLILSSLYGALTVFENIKPYRLDFNTKIEGTNLYELWKPVMEELFSQEDLIIDLASNEFSKMVSQPKITINFRQFDGKEYKNKATYAKMARGKILNTMVINGITTIEEIKKIKFEEYIYEDKLSDNLNLYFVEYK